MRIDVLVAEIGSTTTVVNAIGLGGSQGSLRLLGQGMSCTLEDPGDVTVALKSAIGDLALNLGARDLEWTWMMAASSAAGGLSMSVHGLVYDMTVRAAREAALGAGAVIKMVTAGEMTQSDIEELKRVSPKIILLAGGVDYGEKHTAIWNADMIARCNLACPVIYAGNIAARNRIGEIFKKAGITAYFVDNVYPRVDELVVEPAREVIQKVFEEHIVTAPGMDKIRTMVNGPVMPTPGAVMEACKLLWPVLGDLCAVDVGGATVDVHSVAEGSPEIQAILEAPEPLAKRTVEGDLGIHVNARNIAMLAKHRINLDLGFDPGPVLANLKVIPEKEEQARLVSYLRGIACDTAFKRHAGIIKHLYGPQGRMTVASGKDLSSVKFIIGTGGPLTRLPGGLQVLSQLTGKGYARELYPRAAQVVLDSQYIMATCGVLSRQFPEQARTLLLRSLGLET
ncbi:MAG TPA: DNA mismatch repair protein MutL [Firmicutes bacterium]|nr:DNA mismatch repair protein MutL [Candidatus Fermentithermobacillaceae bacterium]